MVGVLSARTLRCPDLPFGGRFGVRINSSGVDCGRRSSGVQNPGVDVDLSAWSGAALETPAARHRGHVSPGRPRRVFVRLSDEEFQQVEAAAGLAGLTPSGYAGGEVTVAAARAAAGTGGLGSGPELACLQRDLFAVRTALVSAVAVLDANRCAAAVDRVDELADRLHGLLKRS